MSINLCKVWRNILNYGAYGDGLHDDTNAINRAITDGQRCGAGCESSSVKGAIVYFPTGKYKKFNRIPNCILT